MHFNQFLNESDRRASLNQIKLEVARAYFEGGGYVSHVYDDLLQAATILEVITIMQDDFGYSEKLAVEIIFDIQRKLAQTDFA